MGNARSTVFQAGVEEGKALTLDALNNWLEGKYLHDEDRPDRDSPEGKAILDLARQAGRFLDTLKI